MSEFDSDHNADKTPGDGSGPAGSLPHVESPSIMPDGEAQQPAEAAKPDHPVPTRASEPEASQIAMRGTALMLRLPRPEETTAGDAPKAGAPKAKSRRFALTPAAVSMIAVLLGAAIGSGATAGLLRLRPMPVAAPATDPMAYTAALGRIDHELATMKASIEGSAKQSSTQIAKIADRLDRAEKAQADTGSKLARTTESLERIDHRLAAGGSAATETTGSVPSAASAAAAGNRTATLGEPPRAAVPAPAPVLDGWILRDVFNGGAMIQSPRNGILEVIPGDNVPGLGRIEGIRRQDGRWVVVTSRGLIASR